MCSAPKPQVQPLPEPRALAKAPVYNKPVLNGGASKRPTVINPDGIIKSAPTAYLGGSRVVLGG